jgi:hypothetical protein
MHRQETDTIGLGHAGGRTTMGIFVMSLLG